MTLPSFHERNPILLQEAKVLLDRPQNKIGESDRAKGASFYALGSFDSKYLGREIFSGIKKAPQDDTYARRSLANVLLIELYPQAHEMLPLFFGLIKENKVYHIITEDYSCNQTQEMNEIHPFPPSSNLIPRFFVNYMVDDTEELAKIFAYQKETKKLRIMDINCLRWAEIIQKRSLDMSVSFYVESEKLEPYLLRQ